MHRLLLAAVAALLCCGALVLLVWPSNERRSALPADASDPRIEIRGIVERADGTPWSSANVTLVAPFSWGFRELSTVDRIDVISDERGSFHARVLRGWRDRYIVWAVGDEQGSRYHTTVVATLRSGELLRLRQDPEERIRVRLVFHPKDTTITESLSGFASSPTVPAFRIPFPIDEAGEALLPAFPDLNCYIEVYDGRGQFMLSRQIPTGAQVRNEAFRTQQNRWQAASREGVAAETYEPVSPDREHIEFSQPPPILVKVTTRDGYTIPNASLYLHPHLGSPATMLGMTDANGLRVVQRGSDGFLNLHLRIRAKGFVERSVQKFVSYQQRDEPFPGPAEMELSIDPNRDFDEILEAGKPDLRVQLEPSVEIKGRIVLRDDQPAANLPVIAFTEVGDIPARGPRDDSLSSWDPSVSVTDEFGRFSFSSCVPSAAFRLDVALPPEVHARFDPTGNKSLSPRVWIAHGKTPDAGVVELGDLDLTELHLLSLQVLRWDGSIAKNPMLLLGGLENQRLLRGWKSIQLMNLSVDHEGRASALVPKGALVQIAASCEGEIATLQAMASATGTVQVRLHPTPFLEGRVVDDVGAPLADAVVSVSLTDGGPLERVDVPGPDGVTYIRYTGGPWEAIYRWLVLGYEKTDDEGRFKIPVLPGASYHVDAFCTDHGDRTLSVDVEDTTVDGLEIVLEKRK